MLENQWLHIPGKTIIYMARHRIMEGDCQTEHGPVSIHVPAFDILRYPVTNAQFLRFVEETGYAGEGGGNSFLRHLANGLNRENEDQPVTFVSHAEAEAYASYLGARLPTEAQWQLAAGGTHNHRWPWGNTYDPALLNGSGEGLSRVDAHPEGASEFGVEDLCGNAWEWTRELIDDGHHRFALLRGGCWYKGEHFWHFSSGPHPVHSHEKLPLFGGDFDRASTISFRCVREADDHA